MFRIAKLPSAAVTAPAVADLVGFLRAWVLGFCLALGQVAAAATLTVSSTNDSGSGTLRLAIATANSTPAADLINFNIAGEGPHLIQLQSNLPTITAPLTIDGYSQPGALVNTLDEASNAVLMVQLDAAPSLAVTGHGLTVCASDVSVLGLAITNFGVDGISFGGTDIGTLCPDTISNVVLSGSFVGLRPDGAPAATATVSAVSINRAAALIGGNSNAARNVISTLGNAGIQLINDTSGTRIDGNLIGTDPTATLDRGNGIGINVGIHAHDTAIGGDRANLIAHGNDAIAMPSNAEVGSRIVNNRYVDNLQAIDLGSDGISANDLNDTDTGPNNLQNFPVITSALRTATGINVAGVLDRPTGNTPLLYQIDVYASAACTVSGFGGGERRLGGNLVVLSSGVAENFSFSLTLDNPLLLGAAITATATDSGNNTSEFSACTALTEGAGALVVSNTNDSGTGSLRAALIAANANADANVISFAIPGSGPHQIEVSSNLPTITAPLLIDGYSQAGAVANTLTDTSNAVLKVELRALSGLASGVGLSVCSTQVSIRGLAVTNFSRTAISVGTSSTDVLCPAASSAALITGNFLGITPAGTQSVGLASLQVKVLLAGATVGGPDNADRNVIGYAAFGGAAIQLANVTSASQIDGNLLGTDPSGLAPRGDGFGIALGTSATGVLIGQRRPNLIAFATTAVTDGGTSTAANTFGANAYLSSSGLGIDLNGDGVSANDVDDADSGPNNLQNFPELQFAQQRSGGIRVLGRLDVPQSANAGRYSIAFYESVACDSSGHGEGTIYRGSRDVALIDRTTGTDIEDFAINLAGVVAVGRAITATATAPDGSTSEFSRCIAVVGSDQLQRSGFE